MTEKSSSLREWSIPALFLLCAGWAVWHASAFILDLIPPQNEGVRDQISALHLRKDVVPGMPGLFGGYADLLDWVALVSMPVIFALGARTLRIYPMEFASRHSVERFALFIGRITMVMILAMTLVMLYEVFLRYALEAPTLWANELTLWIAGFVFLFSGLYAMQQRCHIRIVLLYDICPRWLQRTFDTIWVGLVVIFAFFLIYGSYHQVFVVKFHRWEMFGTAFDPPIPATVQPMVLIVIALIAIQAVLNLILDWNLKTDERPSPDDADADELATIRRSAGAN